MERGGENSQEQKQPKRDKCHVCGLQEAPWYAKKIPALVEGEEEQHSPSRHC